MGYSSREYRLGRYFEYHRILERFGLTFREFVAKVDNGTWKQFIEEMQSIPGYQPVQDPVNKGE